MLQAQRAQCKKELDDIENGLLLIETAKMRIKEYSIWAEEKIREAAETLSEGAIARIVHFSPQPKFNELLPRLKVDARRGVSYLIAKKTSPSIQGRITLMMDANQSPMIFLCVQMHEALKWWSVYNFHMHKSAVDHAATDDLLDFSKAVARRKTYRQRVILEVARVVDLFKSETE
jgi:hypothetical protein